MDEIQLKKEKSQHVDFNNYKIKIFHMEWTIWHINIKIKFEKYYNIK
jgi:hypothetical protein